MFLSLLTPQPQQKQFTLENIPTLETDKKKENSLKSIIRDNLWVNWKGETIH